MAYGPHEQSVVCADSADHSNPTYLKYTRVMLKIAGFVAGGVVLVASGIGFVYPHELEATHVLSPGQIASTTLSGIATPASTHVKTQASVQRNGGGKHAAVTKRSKPPKANSACHGKLPESSCSFVTSKSSLLGTCQTRQHAELVCMPN